MNKIVLVLASGWFSLLPLHGAALPAGFTETQIGSNIGGTPTAMEIAPDGRIFVCLQGGELRVIKNGALLPTPFVSLSVNSIGERGLLGVAFDPNFANNQFVYVYYTTSSAPVHNRVSRFTASGDVAAVGSEVVLMDLDNLSGATNHNGGAIHFGPDGKLYVAVGENANPANAQSIDNRLGKILRINSDGSIPADNPMTFLGIAGSTTGLNRAIWAVGLRNPFTFGFQPGTGRMFINDVGQNTWEEINDGIVGSNYGWSICEGLCTPPNQNYRDPLFQYAHTGPLGSTGCAIVGAAFYNPATPQFPGSYLGKYFFGDLCNGWIRLFDPAAGTSADFASGISTLVDLKVGDDGSLYYLAQGNGGQVWRVRFPTAITAQAAVSRKVHGGTGTFDLSLPLSGPRGIEPRSGGANNTHNIVFTFENNLQSVAEAAVTSGVGSVSSRMIGADPHQYIVNLTSVADAQVIRLTLFGVLDSQGNSGNIILDLGLLSGDTTGDGNVNAADALQTRNRSGQGVDAANFRSDVNTDGIINTGDSLLVRSRSGTSLP